MTGSVNPYTIEAFAEIRWNYLGSTFFPAQYTPWEKLDKDIQYAQVKAMARTFKALRDLLSQQHPSEDPLDLINEMIKGERGATR